jgi:hypothetical protein
MMDDDFQANDEYFRALKKHSNDELLKDDETESFSPSCQEFPFINASLLQPVTVVVKIGSASGITSGQLIGIIRIVIFERRGKKNVSENAIFLQWEPEQRFTSGGDSLALSTMRSWVLLHTRLRFI